jgi:hypothetical protein
MAAFHRGHLRSSLRTRPRATRLAKPARRPSATIWRQGWCSHSCPPRRARREPLRSTPLLKAMRRKWRAWKWRRRKAFLAASRRRSTKASSRIRSYALGSHRQSSCDWAHVSMQLSAYIVHTQLHWSRATDLASASTDIPLAFQSALECSLLAANNGLALGVSVSTAFIWRASKERNI